MCINDEWTNGEPGHYMNQFYAGMVPPSYSWPKGLHDFTADYEILAMCESVLVRCIMTLKKV